MFSWCIIIGIAWLAILASNDFRDIKQWHSQKQFLCLPYWKCKRFIPHCFISQSHTSFMMIIASQNEGHGWLIEVGMPALNFLHKQLNHFDHIFRFAFLFSSLLHIGSISAAIAMGSSMWHLPSPIQKHTYTDCTRMVEETADIRDTPGCWHGPASLRGGG